VFVPAGYVVFALERRGHGESEGEYIVGQTKLTARMRGSNPPRVSARGYNPRACPFDPS